MPTTPLILVRPPSPRLAEGELTHLDRVPVDPGLAREQWQGYVAAFADHGWDVVEVEEAPEHADGVFVEDALVVVDRLAVLTSPGAPSRRGEVPGVEAALRRLAADGVDLEVARISSEGHLDGGDVLEVGDVLYVGRSARTDDEGIRQLAAHVEPYGRRVVPVPVSKVLHLKSGVTALPDGTVVGYEPLVDDPGAFVPFLAVPEEHGTAVVDLGGGAVVMSADAPRTAELYRARGLDVVTVPISQFEALEGCVTCLSVRVR
ncbi:dimethylargininase [Microlunatus flavus]|uniref:Dimethylargininase n=1 Tax=Microlunatus flavus TaxID=1036181 RepID=A0A1H9I4R8_9ACTN|nr:dimethylargininase [Microlunatus flavus]SEQ69584.1 dimethylargininase [Microlunatus flavus]